MPGVIHFVNALFGDCFPDDQPATSEPDGSIDCGRSAANIRVAGRRVPLGRLPGAGG